MIRIEDYKLGDEIAILNLFKRVFKKELSKEYWNWRFCDNLTNQTLIKLAWDVDKLVSHYAVCPIPMLSNRTNFNGALSMTTMTDPDYNGMGLFPQLANELFSELPKRNIELVYGFPNRNSHYAFIKKLNWENICSIFQFSISNTGRFKSVYDVHSLENINQGHLTNMPSDKIELRINRNIDFYNWRYKTNPINTYYYAEIEKDNIKNFIIFKTFEYNNSKHIDIVELQIEDDIDLLSSFICHINKTFKLSETSMVNIWMSIFNSQFLLLEKLGFIAQEPITYLGYKSFNTINNLTEKQIHFTMGDSDVY